MVYVEAEGVVRGISGYGNSVGVPTVGGEVVFDETYQDNPLVIQVAGQEFRLDYEPGESTTNLFGGNSNWRGPIWMPVNYLILAALNHYHAYYGDAFQVEYPTNSGQMRNLRQVTAALARRLGKLFIRDEAGRRAVFGDYALFQNDPHWRDLIFFHEYFHGDTGRGCGASHQTGWTGLIAHIMITHAGQFGESEERTETS